MNTIEKVLTVIKYFTYSDGPCGVSEISRDLKLSKNNAFRIIKTLENEGWLEQNSESRKYSLTGTITGLGLKVLSRLDIQSISMPYLYDLQRTTGETSTLSLRTGLERMFTYQVQSNHEIRHVVDIGKRYDLWSGASGKVILAFLCQPDIKKVLEQAKESGVSVLASGQKVSAAILRQQIKQIKKQGYAISIGERGLGTCGIAAPIISHDGAVNGAIAVSGPLPRFTLETAENYSDLITGTATKISSILGFKS